MRFRQLSFLLFAGLALGWSAPARAQENMPFQKLDPALSAALLDAITPRHLADLGLADIAGVEARALVSVAPDDCPSACAEELARGMCQCKPEATGACPTRTAAPGPGGLCASLPANVTIFASEGGLGTTRLRLSAREVGY